MSHLSRFNTSVYDFIADLKSMSIMKSEVLKLENYIEITRVNSRALIRNFQKHFLRDIFVTNILTNNIPFFIEYDPSNDLNSNDTTSQELIQRIQNLVKTMYNSNDTSNISKTFDWLKIMCFHAYLDLGIDASMKFRSLQTPNSVQI